MKKIAFIEEAFMGSTLPLVKRFCNEGYTVDIYYVKNRIYEPEATECCFTAIQYGLTHVPQESLSKIHKYIGSNRLNIYLVKLARPYSSVPLLRILMKEIIGLQIRLIAREINKRNYDLVNVVANYDMDHFVHFIRHIHNRTILSLHEVWNHAKPNPIPSPLLNEAIITYKDIVVFSKNNLHSIQCINGIDPNTIHYIPFGKFESYTTLEEKAPVEPLPEKFLLFYGYILPYKGLDILVNALNLMGDELKDYRIVIAGKGEDPVMKQIIDDERFILINHFIPNRELVYLLKRAHAVVCPYKTMSQSGIPQTAFVFNTPVIASDLNGFREIIDKDNGLLFKANDPHSLSQILKAYITTNQLYGQLTENIKKFEEIHPSFNWNNIIKSYRQFLHSTPRNDPH
ncbi:MAG: glycosyltransferase family 4 protein [Prevotella sp.]